MNNPARPLDSLRGRDRNRELVRIATKIREAAMSPVGGSRAVAPYLKAAPEGERAELAEEITGAGGIEPGFPGSDSAEIQPDRPEEDPDHSDRVHIVYRRDEENISDAQVRSQVKALNRDFRARNADIASVSSPFRGHVGDARIEFALATRDPSGNRTTAITRTRTMLGPFSHVDEVQAVATGGADPWDTKRYLNVWVCTLGRGRLGVVQYPGGPPETDGVIIHNRAFGTVGTAMAPFNLGRTAVGRIGKYLNLLPVWGEETGCKTSDLVADTPLQFGPNYGKPTFPRVSCMNGPNGDMFMNFMDDVDDDAMFMFTKGQVVRMHETLAGPRQHLVVTENHALS